MKKIKLAVIALCFALCLALLAGCQTTAETGSAGEEDSEQSTVYIIATDTTFAPFEYQDENGDYVGIDIDLLAAIAADQGFQYELQPLGFDAACAALESQQCDGVIAGMSITEERKSRYDFSDPYFDSGVVLAAKADSTVESLEDLRGQAVAVKNGTEGAAYAESIAEEYELELRYFDESPLMYQEVITGNAAACCEDYPVIGYGIATGNLELKMVGEMQAGSSYGFAVSTGQNAELLEMFNTGLANLVASGAYDEIVGTYIQAG
ncbi:MAG: transporter substrate-binding domain-containing protein [Oscillospiraceae bacterium]|nr:transporter substrate-binding domain-containing protein [Oscillospiraceae bacterium]